MLSAIAPNKSVDHTTVLPASFSSPAAGNMYLPVNFRWPSLGQSLVGSSGSPHSSSQSPVSAAHTPHSTVHSAFKTVPSSSSSSAASAVLSGLTGNGSLGSLTGTTCAKESTGGGLSGHGVHHGNMNLGMQQGLAPPPAPHAPQPIPPSHPASQMGPTSHSYSQGVQSMGGMGLCPPYHGTAHHTGVHSGPLPSMSGMDDKSSLAGMSMAGLASQYKDALCPSLAAPPPPPPPPPSTHPAFPVPMWLQQSQAAAATAYNLSHLQQVFGHDKAAFAASQYLAAADPFAKAANPFLDLARMGHYPLGKKLFGCPQCRYITDRKNNLKRHIATMHQECDKTLECCGVVFKNKASLRDHVLIFHSNGYMCRFCGRNFCRKALLKRHLTVHSGQKDYICSLCDYATSHKSNLERHKKVHERQSQDGSELEIGSSDLVSHKLPDSSNSTGVSSTSDELHIGGGALPPHHSHHHNPHHPHHHHRDGGASGLPTATSSPRAGTGSSGGRLGPLPSLDTPAFSPSMADTSFTSDSLTETEDDLALSPINVDDDPNALIDVVELAN